MARLFSGVLAGLLALVLTVAASHAQGEGGMRDLLGQLLRGTQQDQGAGGQAAIADNGKRVPFGQREMELSFAPLVKRTAPAVVNVYAKSQVRQPVSPFAGDPFFEQFFGGGRPARPRVQQSLGSGVIVDASGLVVTNYHVIRGGDEVKVALADGREFESEVLLKDETVDLAVLRIDSDRPLPFLQLGDSDALWTHGRQIVRASDVDT